MNWRIPAVLIAAAVLAAAGCTSTGRPEPVSEAGPSAAAADGPVNTREAAAATSGVPAAGAPVKDARPWQTPYEKDGVRILPISDFEAGEQVWVGYDNIELVNLEKGAPGPEGYFNLGSVHPEYDGAWYRVADGHGFSTEQVKSGAQSLKWFNTPVSSRLVIGAVPHDWSAYGFLSFWLYSETDNYAAIEIVPYSENPANPGIPNDDYFKKEIVLSWKGWQFVEIPFEEFVPTRQPVGFNRIDYIKIASSGWGHTAQPGTVVYLDSLQLTTESIREDPLAKIPVTFPHEEHPYLFATAGDFLKIREKIDHCGWAKNAYAALKLSADAVLAGPVSIPDTGGGFYHNEEEAEEYGITEEHYRLSRAARDLGLMYRLSGDSAYAGKAKDILLGYAEKYRTYELHDKYGVKGPKATSGGRATAQTINEAKWVIALAWGYDLVCDRLSAAERERVETGVFREAASILRGINEGKHNHQAWNNAGVGVIGFLLKDPDLVRYAVFGGDNGFLFQMKTSITAEGMWYEGSGHYQFYTMEPLLALAEAAYTNGLDLYRQTAFGSYFSFPLRYADVDGRLPLLNDGRLVELSAPDRAKFFEIAYARLGDRRLVPFIEASGRASLESLVYGAAELPPPQETGNAGSLLFPGALAVLRSPDNRLQLTLNGLPYAGGHSHYDKLSITLSGPGRTIVEDSGSVKYRNPEHEGYLKKTVAHNTVLRDRANQVYGGPAQVVAFTAGPLFQFVRMKDTAAYPGSVLERSLLVSDSWVFDLFSVKDAVERTWEWAFRSFGRLTAGGVSFRPAEPGKSDGFEYLVAPREAEVRGDLGLSWDLYGGKRLDVYAFGESGGTLTTAQVPVAADRDDELNPILRDMVLLGKKAGATAFAALLVPREGGRSDTPLREAVTIPDAGQRKAAEAAVPELRPQAVRFSNRASGTEDLLLWNAGRFADVRVGDIETDAAFMAARYVRGELSELFLFRAGYLRRGAFSLRVGPDIEGMRQTGSLLHLKVSGAGLEIVQDGEPRMLVTLGGFGSGTPAVMLLQSGGEPSPVGAVETGAGKISFVAEKAAYRVTAGK